MKTYGTASGAVLLVLLGSLGVGLYLRMPWRARLAASPSASVQMKDSPVVSNGNDGGGVIVSHKGKPAKSLFRGRSLQGAADVGPVKAADLRPTLLRKTKDENQHGRQLLQEEEEGTQTKDTSQAIRHASEREQLTAAAGVTASVATETQRKTTELSKGVTIQNRAGFIKPCDDVSHKALKQRLHNDNIGRRKNYWQYLHKSIRGPMQPWQPSDPSFSSAYVHMSVEPTWTCHEMRRLGGLGDGGKMLCDAGRLLTSERSPPPLVYSFGSRLECTFEEDIRQNFPRSEIHIFDPTPGVVEGFNNTKCAQFASFHGVGLGGLKKSLFLDGINGYGGRDVRLQDLFSIQSKLGHQNRVIDVLKIDVEGSEFDVFNVVASKAAQYGWRGAKLIMVEVHLFDQMFKGRLLEALETFKKLFSDFEAMGYRVYYKELNPYDGKKCAEYALINDKYLF